MASSLPRTNTRRRPLASIATASSSAQPRTPAVRADPGALAGVGTDDADTVAALEGAVHVLVDAAAVVVEVGVDVEARRQRSTRRQPRLHGGGVEDRVPGRHLREA